jgi:hypothetical protein
MIALVWRMAAMGLRMKGLESITSPLLLATEKGFVVVN